MFLTPKPDTFPLIMPASRTLVLSIFLPNILCALLHMFTSLPEAAEGARGYLHGGVMVDFIGQTAPKSKLSLLLLDLGLLLLQCLMLAIHSEREKLRSVVRSAKSRSDSETEPNASTNLDGSAAEPPTIQDHDREERGVTNSTRELPVAENGDIELQPISQRAGHGQEGSAEERHLLTSRPSSQTRNAMQLSEMLNSGNAILGEFHIMNTIRTATTDYQGAAAHSLQTLGYTTAIAALTAQRRAQVAANPR
jgi:hypothetical protein